MTYNEYILEFIPHGRYMRVCAVDPETGIEAVIVGDVRETREHPRTAASR